MHVLEALQHDHELTVLAVGEADLEELNQYYGTTVSDVNFDRLSLVDFLSAGLQLVPGTNLSKLVLAIQNRVLSTKALSEYDLIISTKNERHIDRPSIQYIHYPQTGHIPTNQSGVRRTVPNVFVKGYDALCDVVSPTIKPTTETRYLSNSAWTASIATEMLDAPVSVLYPPVSTDDLQPVPWAQRRDRILSVGRLYPDKRLLRSIDIVSGVVERGHDIQFDIVGPPAYMTQKKPYVEQVKRAASRHDFVNYVGEVSRGDLATMLSTYKYGLHGKDDEHFGIAVAEMVAGGVIPFVPDDGGQCEIVDYDDRLLYASAANAVELIDAVLSDDRKQQDIREQLPDIDARFGHERFHKEMRDVVEEMVGPLEADG